jgi:hypothetical protein
LFRCLFLILPGIKSRRTRGGNSCSLPPEKFRAA